MNRSFHDSLDGTQPCRLADPRWFFPGQNDRGAAVKGKALCRTCPFQQPCLQYALGYDLHGVWGGTTRQERQTYQRDRDIRPTPVQIPSALTGARTNQNGTR